MTGSRHARHTAPRSRRGRAVGVVIAALVLLAVLFAGGLLVGRATSSSAAGPTAGTATPTADTGSAGVATGDGASAAPAAATDALPSRPTMLAGVTRVVTGNEIVVRVGTTEVPVRVLGLDTPDPTAGTVCGGREALAYADRRLSGQTVTLVPDPTLPEFDDQGHRLSYVVLRSQLSYTDAALMDGIGRVDTSRPLWYAAVFAQEQVRAAAARVGIWGAPCEARP